MNGGMGAQTVVLVRRRMFPRGMASFFAHPVAAPLPALGGPIRCGIGSSNVACPVKCGMGQGIDLSSDPGVSDVSDTWDSGFSEGYSAAANVAQAPSTNYGALFAAATPSILTGVAQVVKASNTPGIAYSGVVTNSSQVATSSSSGLLLLVVVVAVGAVALGHKS